MVFILFQALLVGYMYKLPVGSREFRNLIIATCYFVFLALLLYFVKLGQLSWDLLLASAILWFAIEFRDEKHRKRLPNALKIGAFLLVFDFAFENSGWLLGLWQTFSTVAVGVVPIQVMGIAFFGGAAWAGYLPKKFSFWHSLPDCVVFAFFGALGERLLIWQGLFVYKLWWTSVLAFAAYFLTWMLLHFVRYRIFAERKY